MKLGFYGQIFQKYSNIKFREYPSNGSLVVPYGHTDGRTDRHDEHNSRSSQFCERAQKILKLFPHSVSAYCLTVIRKTVITSVDTELFINQLQCTILYSITIRLLHYYPRHVSGINMPIFRRKDCIQHSIWYLRSVNVCTVHRLRAKHVDGNNVANVLLLNKEVCIKVG
jgi:hypothetical protein